MKMKVAVRLLKLLPTTAANAMTVADIAKKWYDYEPSKEEKRNIQRYIVDLASDEDDGASLINTVEGYPRRFYLRLSQVANWFMTEEAALTILLTGQSMAQTLTSLNSSETSPLADIAEKVASASLATQRIRERVRLVPDGLGRLPAHIPAEVIKASIDAIANLRQLTFHYRTSSGVESKELVSVQGMIVKDGAIYLIGTKGLADSPRYYGLQRMSQVEVSHRPHQDQTGFNFDRYINDSNLSSRLREHPGNIDLELKVQSEAIYHFRERPLSKNQIIATFDDEASYTVNTNIPWSVALVPFLLSLGDGIEVIKPKRLRVMMGNHLTVASQYYKAI